MGGKTTRFLLLFGRSLRADVSRRLTNPIRGFEMTVITNAPSHTNKISRGERRPCPTTSSGWARGVPVALTLTALAPQLFRDLVVRSFCVSRFTVNKKAQISRDGGLGRKSEPTLFRED